MASLRERNGIFYIVFAKRVDGDLKQAVCSLRTRDRNEAEDLCEEYGEKYKKEKSICLAVGPTENSSAGSEKKSASAPLPPRSTRSWRPGRTSQSRPARDTTISCPALPSRLVSPCW